MQVVGVDAGGTFTDAVLLRGDGARFVGKALSVPAAPEQGVLASLGVAAEAAGTSLGEMLAATDVIAHGTTVGLNALLTGNGAAVGLLTTAGFEATLPMARANKVHGLPADELRVPARWRTPDLLVPRQRIVGLAERIDRNGEVLEALAPDDVDRSARRLLDAGATSFAVALLWSPANPAHEQLVAERLAVVAPRAHVSVSSELAPRLGEYERTTTVVVDAFVAPLVADYLARLETSLGEHRFAGRLLVMRMGGGVQAVTMARRQPVTTLHSGPIGGVIAAARLGPRHVVTSDVGGTSFDVGVVIDGEVQFARQPRIERQPLAVPVVDVTSIAIGGGSIAWVDEALGVLRVGPQSAGADPGPAAYGRGGTRPTLTDAAVVLGHVASLGARLRLDVDAARGAVAAVAEPLGLTVEHAAEGIVEIASEQMRQLIRRTVLERGHDPADFVLAAFGGAGAQYVARYAGDTGVAEVVVPRLAAEFSAFGAATCEQRAAAERDVPPGSPEDRLHTLGNLFAELTESAAAQLGAPPSAVERTVALRYFRQTTRIDIPVPERFTAEDLGALRTEFHRRYELVVGPGTSRPQTPVEVVGASVQVAAGSGADATAPWTAVAQPSGASRPAIFDGAAHDTPVLQWDALPAGWQRRGPLIVESPRTTVVVPPSAGARVDDNGNIWMDLR